MTAAAPAGLLEEHEALLQFLYIAPVGLLQARSDGELVLVNPLCAKLLMPLTGGVPVINLFDALESVAPDLRQRVRSFEEAYGLVVEDLQVPIEAGHRGRPGAQVLSVTILKLDAERLMAVIKDITDVVRRERQLRHAQAWIETIVNGLADYALLELDEHGRIRESNVGLERVTGFGAGAAGRPFTLFLPKERVTDFTVADRLTEARESGWSLDEGWRHRADGSRFWGSCLIAPLSVEGDAEPGFSLILRDISHARESREQIRDAVFADHLTGLANRRCFHESAALELARWRRQPRPLSVLAIDADHFKAINDRYGHLAGDAVLRHLAVGLSGQFRSVDLLARFGGEEFVALLPGTDLAGAEALAQRAVESLAACPATVDGVSIPCTISIGVAAMSPAIDDLAALLQQADDALYAAKAAGRNRAMRWRPHHARVAAASGSP